jgi:hypothetical protein
MEVEMETGADKDKEWMMEGGAKRTDINKGWCEGLFFMIKNAKHIECISASSLYGFIFVVELKDDIKNDEIPFVSITIGQQDSKIKKLLLKFSLVYKDSGDKKQQLKQFMKKNKFNRKRKGIDTVENFKEEVKTQITVFETTYSNKKLANCPSIVFARACSNNESRIFLQILSTWNYSQNFSVLTRQALDYLHYVIKTQPDLQLGIIAMEYAEDTGKQSKNNKFVLFDQLYKRILEEPAHVKWGNKNKYDNVYVLYHRIALILSNMIVLLLECGIVHCDLHFNNVFVINYTKNEKGTLINSRDGCIYPVENTTAKSCIRIIDFGRVKKGVEYKGTKESVDTKENFVELLKKYKINDNPGGTPPNRGRDIGISPDATLYEGILKILTIVYKTDLDYTRGIDSAVEYPQCVGYFILGGLLKNESENKITNPFIPTDKLAGGSKYIMDLISGYLIAYYTVTKTPLVEPVKKQKEGAPSTDTIYDPESEDKPSFREQLLQYYLEILHDNLGLENYEITTYTTTRFDLITTGGDSIRNQRPDLEGVFQSIDEIIKLLSTDASKATLTSKSVARS